MITVDCNDPNEKKDKNNKDAQKKREEEIQRLKNKLKELEEQLVKNVLKEGEYRGIKNEAERLLKDINKLNSAQVNNINENSLTPVISNTVENPGSNKGAIPGLFK